jgi:hypothetical protein
LTAEEKQALECAAGPGYSVSWFEGASRRLAVALVLFRFAKLRLTMPETFELHRRIIEWDSAESEDRIPDRALGVDRISLALMRFALKSEHRVNFLNRYLAGTWPPRIQMDFLPGWACGAHMMIKSEAEPNSIDDFVGAGGAVQRVWLTVTKLGLWQQPEMTPLIFSRYVRQGLRFTVAGAIWTQAEQLALELNELLGDRPERAVWLGRIGAGSAPIARSTRLPLPQLLTKAGNEQRKPS